MQEVAQLTMAAESCAAAPLWSLPESDLLEFLDTVHAAEQMVRAAKAHAVREIEGRGIPATQHAPTPVVWLRGRLRISSGAAAKLLAQARALASDPVLDAAFAAGQVNEEQMDAIVRTLGDLPKELGPEIRTRAADLLLQWVAQLDPVELRRAGRRILDHVAPEVAEAAEEAALRRAERQAYEQRFLTLSPIGDARVRVRGILDATAAATITAALDPLCRPPTAAEAAVHAVSETNTASGKSASGETTSKETASGETASGGPVAPGDTRTPGQRRADALVEVCQMVLVGGAGPEAGVARPQMTVTVAFDVLSQKLGAGELDTGEPVSADTVRRLACDARLLPVVLGGKSQVLDVGRSRRLVTGSLRQALIARDRGCTFPGCDRPARWCDAHHMIPWAEGGATALCNLALLCGHHHRVVHGESDWRIRLGPDNHPEFLPPDWLDPQQVPRTNPYHRRT